MGYSILSRRDRIELENGMFLRLLSALELMQARRAASLLAEEEQERALCSNAQRPGGAGRTDCGGDLRAGPAMESIQPGGKSRAVFK